MKLFTTIERSKSTGKIIKELFHDYLVVHVSAQSVTTEDYWADQAREIGDLKIMDEDLATGNKTGKFWIDIKYDPAFPNHFIHANARQPLHTDGSYESDAPNISFFYCIQEALMGGATTYIDINTVKECLKWENNALLERLFDEPLLFSKGNDSKRSAIFHDDKCNWNYYRTEKVELAELFHDFLERRIINMGITNGVRLKPGEALFFRDDMILHGRNAFMGNRWLRKGGIEWTAQ
jgi:alpha-ketoglutarate-dependent taurine dioxygenase